MPKYRDYSRTLNSDEYGQIVLVERRVDDVPALEVHFNVPKSFSSDAIGTFTFKWEDNKDGWAKADKALETITKEEIEKAIKGLLEG